MYVLKNRECLFLQPEKRLTGWPEKAHNCHPGPLPKAPTGGVLNQNLDLTFDRLHLIRCCWETQLCTNGLNSVKSFGQTGWISSNETVSIPATSPSVKLSLDGETQVFFARSWIYRRLWKLLLDHVLFDISAVGSMLKKNTPVAIVVGDSLPPLVVMQCIHHSLSWFLFFSKRSQLHQSTAQSKTTSFQEPAVQKGWLQ